jgi:hypothetical protein
MPLLIAHPKTILERTGSKSPRNPLRIQEVSDCHLCSVFSPGPTVPFKVHAKEFRGDFLPVFFLDCFCVVRAWALLQGLTSESRHFRGKTLQKFWTVFYVLYFLRDLPSLGELRPPEQAAGRGL